MFQVNNMLQSFKEPYVNLGQFLDTLDSISFFHGLCDGKDTEVCWVCQCIVEVIEACVVIAYKSVQIGRAHV